MTKDAPDPLMARLQALFEESRLTLDELGQRMGYIGPTTRASAWQFLNRTNDPRLSMLRKFAQAVGVSLAELFTEAKQQRNQQSEKRKAEGSMGQQARTREEAEKGVAIDQILVRLEGLGIDPFYGHAWEDRRTGLKMMTIAELRQVEQELQAGLDANAARLAVVRAITASRRRREDAC